MLWFNRFLTSILLISSGATTLHGAEPGSAFCIEAVPPAPIAGFHRAENVEAANLIKRADLVLQGGGALGVAHVGAYLGIAEEGYTIQSIAGSSAGALFGALIIAGYTPEECLQIALELNLKSFQDPTFLSRIPLVGNPLSIAWSNGVFKGDFAYKWIKKLLADKDIHTFGDLHSQIESDQKDPRYKYRLQVVATDLIKHILVVLPSGIRHYNNMDPDKLEVAAAIRASMSVPWEFIPYIIKGSYAPGQKKTLWADGLVAGGNMPWIFDQAGRPDWPTFGVRFAEVDTSDLEHHPLKYAEAVAWSIVNGSNNLFLEANESRIFDLPTLGFSPFDFALDRDEKLALIRAAKKAAEEFFSTWNFDAYVARHRNEADPGNRINQRLVQHLLNQGMRLDPHKLRTAA